MVDFKQKLAEKKLKEQLDKVKKDSAPNLNPGFRNKKEPTPPPPDIAEFGLKPKEEKGLRELISRHAEIGKVQGMLKKEKDTLNNEIKPICSANGLDKFMVDGVRATYYKQTRNTISMEKLLAHGVSPQIISACTEEKVVWAFKTSMEDEDESV